MVITAGKDCFVKFWHLTSANPKPQIQKSKTAKEEETSRESSPGNMGNPWLGADSVSDSDSEDEIQETKPKQKTEKEQVDKIEEVQDTKPKEEAKKEEKKKEEPEESDSDDDLTGWY